jgi:hypothetical protein
MNAFQKLRNSSTFWASLVLPALNLVLQHFGIIIPWEVIGVGIGSYGVKEAAGKVLERKFSEPGT